MNKPHADRAQTRREQIVEAAVAIIAEQGLDKLSLSRIEERAGMSRGQLTYYFPTREDILLAVFDRFLLLIKQRVESGEGPCAVGGTGWERIRQFLNMLVLRPPAIPEFHAIQYTFLAQMGHRDDLRDRLAALYEEWRQHLAADLEPELARRNGRHTTSARTLASFIQAVLHGLAMQRAADPDAYDRQEMLELFLHLLGNYLQAPDGSGKRKRPRVTQG
jgi:AcrR family transcriptional regulator